MDNIQKQEPEKKKLGWLWWIVIAIVLIIVVWVSKSKIDAQMKKVRSFREPKEEGTVTYTPPKNV